MVLLCSTTLWCVWRDDALFTMKLLQSGLGRLTPMGGSFLVVILPEVVVMPR